MLARELIEAVLPALAELRSLRAQAYLILAAGLLSTDHLKAIEPLETLARSAAQRLMECYQRSQRPDWPWFESRMTYANAVLPHALFVAARRWPDDGFLQVAAASFEFLDTTTTEEKVFWPIGNSDWYSHGEEKSLYDQQPVEASTMADAALVAHALLLDEKYLDTFRRAHAWFRGENNLKLPLADIGIGACYDGLQPTETNQNQGAESTLAYLWTEVLRLEVQNSSLNQRNANLTTA
jgi:hypothetical protein